MTAPRTDAAPGSQNEYFYLGHGDPVIIKIGIMGNL